MHFYKKILGFLIFSCILAFSLVHTHDIIPVHFSGNSSESCSSPHFFDLKTLHVARYDICRLSTPREESFIIKENETMRFPLRFYNLSETFFSSKEVFFLHAERPSPGKKSLISSFEKPYRHKKNPNFHLLHLASLEVGPKLVLPFQITVSLEFDFEESLDGVTFRRFSL